MKSLSIVAAFLSLFILENLQAQEATQLAILPVTSNGVDSVIVQTSESILRTEIAKLSRMELISARRTHEALAGVPCRESECATQIGKSLDAEQVLLCQLSALGGKVIVRYVLVEVATGKEMLIDQVTSLTPEDLEMVMKRLAKSVVDREPIEKGAEVGNVIETEAKEHLRRTSRKNFGLGFGYLYPSEGYDNEGKSFIIDGRFDYEMDEFAAGMVLGIRKGFAMNLYGSYLISRSDVCPYIGGGIGFHWVAHKEYLSNYVSGRDVTSDGLELSAHTGLRLLHTYNFQMIVHLEFSFTMNDYNDKAVVFTLGIL